MISHECTLEEWAAALNHYIIMHFYYDPATVKVT